MYSKKCYNRCILNEEKMSAHFNSKIPDGHMESVLERLASGETYASIGKTYGLSRERIRQIAQKNNLHRVGMEIRSTVRKATTDKKMRELYGEFFDGNKVSEKSLMSRCKEKYRAKKSHAQKCGVVFDVEFQDIKWNRVCPILGITIDYFTCGYQAGDSASFDRVVSELGYVKGNVQIISMRANVLKGDGTAEEHLKVAEYMLENMPDKKGRLTLVSHG